MKKRYALLLTLLVTLLIFVDYSFFKGNFSFNSRVIDEDFSKYLKEKPSFHYSLDNASTISIASWNLQVFGQKKALDNELMKIYKSVIAQYDIIFIQEIKDISGTAFVKLCSSLADYNCMNSSRAGRSQSKEQIGVIYRKGIGINYFQDFNLNKEDRWEYAPIVIGFNIEGVNISVYNAHTKPSDVEKELKNLEAVFSNDGMTLVLGDLNADCYYYNRKLNNDFSKWHWIIGDREDTTVSNSSCAYDRIILNDLALDKISAYGIYEENISEKVSDHYPIWVEFEIDRN